ncbi:MAG: DUF3093 domain-containing protein [Nocardioidaceae bacterium]
MSSSSGAGPPAEPSSDARPVSYVERLHPPVGWWLLAGLFVLSVWWAFALATPRLVAALAAAVAAAVAGGLLLGWGSSRVAVHDGQLSAGRAQIPVGLCGPAEALDADGTRRLHGRDADARAYLLLRPYIATSVRVPIDDPDDPAPYWLLSTRHPDHVVAAVHAARSQVAH